MLKLLKMSPGDCETPEDWDLFIEPGWRILDVDRPEWYEQVDTGRLNMLSIYRCVLGQVYGDWGIGCDRITSYADRFEDPQDILMVQCAFAGAAEGPIQDAWVREIERRKAAAA